MKFRLKKKDLKEVKREVDQIENLDPKIRELIVGFRVWNVPTTNSCEGHNDAKPYPWLMIPFPYIEEAGRILCEWDYRQEPRKKIIWIIEPTAAPGIRPLVENHKLEDLQEDAVKFGLFLQNLPKNFNWSKDWY